MMMEEWNNEVALQKHMLDNFLARHQECNENDYRQIVEEAIKS